MPNLEALQAPQELLILGAATRCGIIDRIWAKGKISAAELAAELELDLRGTWTVTEALIALGYLTREPAGGREDGLLSLTPEAQALLFDTRSKSYIGRAYMHAYGMVGSWYQLPAVIKTGKSVPRESDTKHTVAFMHAMRRSGGPAAAAITKTAVEGLPAPFRVLDLGGGPLTHARAFAALGGRVTVLDTTPVVEMMGPELKPDEPVTLVAGDFTRELPAGPFDIAYMGNITH
ncbi:MAG: class I SAM-dependent methyltransferase, partial [Heliobacteriaceae bacterium]|nr:class I SAM-dependent methyltransferase [Heliobacteriaceae bacterium]